LNIGEGAGEFRPLEKARFYRMALRSATECASTLDVMVYVKAAERGRVEGTKKTLEQIVAMLVALCKRLAPEGAPKGKGRGQGKGTGDGEGKGKGGKGHG
jgi:hypothetical protein